MLLVAYPVQNKKTEFEFKYVVAQQESSLDWAIRESSSALSTFIQLGLFLIHFAKNIEFDSPEKERVLYLFYAIILTIIVLFCLISICISSCLSLITPKSTKRSLTA